MARLIVIRITRKPINKKPKRTMYRSERANLLNNNYIRNNNIKSTKNKESDNKE